MKSFTLALFAVLCVSTPLVAQETLPPPLAPRANLGAWDLWAGFGLGGSLGGGTTLRPTRSSFTPPAPGRAATYAPSAPAASATYSNGVVAPRPIYYGGCSCGR